MTQKCQFKIDENLPVETAETLRQAGFKADTVHDEKLTGTSDLTISGLCKRDQKIIVTLDADFSDIRSYPPSEYEGIIVLRLVNQSKPCILRIVRNLVVILIRKPINKQLWIVEENQIRIRE